MENERPKAKFAPKAPTCQCHGVYLDQCPIVIAALRADDEFEPPKSEQEK